MSDFVDKALELFLDELDREKQLEKKGSKPGKRKIWNRDIKRFRMVRAQMKRTAAKNPRKAIIEVAKRLRPVIAKEYQEPDTTFVEKSYKRVSDELQKYLPAAQIASSLLLQSEQDYESGIDESLNTTELSVEPPHKVK